MNPEALYCSGVGSQQPYELTTETLTKNLMINVMGDVVTV